MNNQNPQDISQEVVEQMEQGLSWIDKVISGKGTKEEELALLKVLNEEAESFMSHLNTASQN